MKTSEEEHIAELQEQINKIILQHVNDIKSMLTVASILLTTSIKCYKLVFNDQELLILIQRLMDDIIAKNKLH
jgi:hypothetical protein